MKGAVGTEFEIAAAAVIYSVTRRHRRVISNLLFPFEAPKVTRRPIMSTDSTDDLYAVAGEGISRLVQLMSQSAQV